MHNFMHNISRLMGMSDDIWARHANPWSVWTRVAATPFIFLALWSHVWLDWWALIPIALAALWVWLNPRLFPPPHNYDSWAAQGVLGERIYLTYDKINIPGHHWRAGRMIAVISLIFMSIAAYGIVIENIWAAALGYHAGVLAKLWFVDRMVWLYRDMRTVAQGS